MKNSDRIPRYYVICSKEEEENYRKQHGEIGNKIYDVLQPGLCNWKTCIQLFVTAEGFADGMPLKSEGDAHEALEKVCQEVGIPKLLISDGAKQELYGDWGKVVKHKLIQTRQTETYSGWQNRCEDEIHEVKKHYTRIMALNRCPKAFWDFGWKYTIKLRK